MKPRPELIPAEALLAVARVLAFGEEKHRGRTWEAGRPRSEDYGALLRHALDYGRGERADAETTEHPMAHVAARALMILAADQRGLPGGDEPEFQLGLTFGAPVRFAFNDAFGGSDE